MQIQRQLIDRLLQLEHLEERHLLVAQLVAGVHYLAPDLTDQSIEIRVQNAHDLNGVNLRAQLGDGFGPESEPAFSDFHTRGTIWSSKNVVQFGGPLNGRSSLLQASIALVERIPLARDGVIARLIVDTTAFHSGNYELRLSNTEIGEDSDLAGVNADVVNGEIRIARPGDANLDGVFSSSDLVAVFRAGEFDDAIVGNSNWSDGDWNGNGEFTTADLVLAFQQGRYDPLAANPVDQAIDRTSAEPGDIAASLLDQLAREQLSSQAKEIKFVPEKPGPERRPATEMWSGPGREETRAWRGELLDAKPATTDHHDVTGLILAKELP